MLPFLPHVWLLDVVRDPLRFGRHDPGLLGAVQCR
jgi:hypothetical protein